MGKLASQLILNGIDRHPKIVVGIRYLDLFGPHSYADENSFLGTNYLSVSKFLNGNLDMLNRFKELGIRYVVFSKIDSFRNGDKDGLNVDAKSLLALIEGKSTILCENTKGIIFQLDSY